MYYIVITVEKIQFLIEKFDVTKKNNNVHHSITGLLGVFMSNEFAYFARAHEFT